MSPRDPPLWARGLAVLLLIVAAWSLGRNEMVVRWVGESVGLVSLGVLAGFILRGMHLPLGLWSEGPWRDAFSLPAALITGGVFGGLVLVARIGGAAAPVAGLDAGAQLAAVGGVAGWGLAVAFVRQQPFLRWYGVALAAALAPVGTGVIGGSVPTPATHGIAAFVALLSVFAASSLITIELGFRRLLIGRSARPGLAVVAAAAAAWVLWAELVGAGPHHGTLELALVGLVAGSLYALSGSLLVSALYSGMVSAAHAALVVPSPESGWSAPEVLAAHGVIVVLLGGVVWRRHGVVGRLREGGESHAAGD